ncbi:MAG: amino acid-binding protein [Clostridiales bacterium]|nr:amino acid-binding protein [Clostridiales bacterium]
MYGIKQISVFLENKEGRLAKVTKILAQEKINIRALCVADTADFGILRLIVNRPDAACAFLKKAGFAVTITEVIAVKMADSPGSLSDFLQVLRECGVNLEYMYAFGGVAKGSAINVIRVDRVSEVFGLLLEKGVALLSEEEVYEL